jgi:predicted TIM-barrel enzyme
MAYADGAIIGTWFKRHGAVERPVDPCRVRALCEVVHRLG